MSNYEKKKLVTGKTFAKILGIVVGGFFGLFGITLGIMYLAGSFDRPVIPPESIAFEISESELMTDENGVAYYSPEILTQNGDGSYSVADYFYLTVNPTNEDVTEKAISLSVSNNDVIKLENSTGELGTPIKILICKDENGIPYGGYSSLTTRSNSGINGMAKLNIFIDVPVQSLDIVTEKTSKSESSLFVNEVMTLKEPTFYPAKSKNPSTVNEGTATIKKDDKEYIYKVEFKVVTESASGTVENWIDIDSADSLNNEQNRVVYWTDASKTSISALKTGEFRLKVYAFDTYQEQEKNIMSELEAEKLERMRAVSEISYFTITEVDYMSITSNAYDSTKIAEMPYKKTGFKVYLRTTKTEAQLASENAINLDLQINPNDNYGISAEDLYSKLANIYISTSLTSQDDVLKIYGREVAGEDDSTLIYPYFDDSGEYEDEALKEYYYLFDVVGKVASDFNLVFNIVNPNDSEIISLNVRAKTTEVETTVFGFTKPSDMTNVGVYEELDVTQNNGTTTMDITIETIDMAESNYVDLSKFIVNKAENNQTPTYDKVRYYVYIGNTVDQSNINRQEISTIVQLEGFEFVEILSGVYAIEIVDGRLVPLSYGSIKVYAVLIQTDINGNEVPYSVTGTTTYKSAEMNINIDVLLNSVSLEIVDENFEELEDFVIKENYNYNLIITPLINGNATSNSLLEKNIENLNIVINSRQVIADGIITYDEQREVYYLPISVPLLTTTAQPVQISCYLKDGEEDVYLGATDEYEILSTAVKSLTIQNKDYYEYKAFWNGSSNSVVWQDLSTGNNISGDNFEINVTIVGENQNYELHTSDRSAITVESRGSRTYLKFIKPSDSVVVVTARSMENAEIYDSIQIKLVSEEVVFNVDNASAVLGKTLRVDATGDVTENNQVFSESVYKGDAIDMFDRIGITCGTETNCNGLVTFEFETSADCVKFDESNPSTVVFFKNVSTSQNITVVVKSLFGQTMKYRFRISNYISVEYIASLPYNDSISSISGSQYQDRAVMSNYNGSEYVTFVWNQNKNGTNYNKLDFSALLNITSKSPTQAVENLRYSVSRNNNGNRYININANGVISTNSTTSLQITSPQVVYIEVVEDYVSDSGVEEIIFSKSFPILLVPNLKVTTSENLSNKTVFNAGEYVFTENILDKYTFSDEGDLQIDLESIFVVKDFASNNIDIDSITFAISNPTGNASITDNVLTVLKNKVFADTTIEIKQTLIYNGATFESTANINVVPYYGIYVEESSNLLIDGSKDTISIYTGQSILLTDIISVQNDTSSGMEDSISYSILSNTNTVIRIQEASSNRAKLVATAYSGDYLATVSLRIGGEDTGFILKVKVVHDLGAYGVNNTYVSNEEQPYKINSNEQVYLSSIFVAKKLSNTSADVVLSYTISDETVAYIDNYNRVCFYPCAYPKKVTITASTGLQDVEKLVCVFEVQPSQSMTITYKYAENDITAINKSLYSEDESAVGALGYIELKPYDRVDLKDYIQAVNVIGGIREDIFNTLNFEIEQFDFENSEWITSTLYSIRDLSTTVPYIQPTDNYADPVYTRIKVTSAGGLLGYFNVLLATNSSVNSEGNVIITMNYPANSSNYYEDNLTYECVTQDTSIDLTNYDSLNNRRIYAEFNRINVTSELVFSYYAYAMETMQEYTGTGIAINGNIVNISSEVPTGTVIKIYMHNSYQEFTNTYNIYVGGNTVIKFKNALTGTGENAYNSSITYDAVYSNNNIVYLSNLFTITNLAGENIDLKVGGKVTISLENNYNDSYYFARLVNVASGSDNVPTYIAIDNYANQGGQIVSINIDVEDENGVITSAVYKLKVAPSVVVFTNADGSTNSSSNPYQVYGVASSTEYLLYKESGSDATNLIDINTILTNAQSGITYDISSLSLSSNDSSLSVVSSTKFAFSVNSTVLSETDVVLNITTLWGRVLPYYVKLLPSTRLLTVSSNENVIDAYSLTDLDLFDDSQNTYISVQAYDAGTNQYVEQSYDSNLIIIEIYNNGVIVDTTTEDAIVNVQSNGVLSFGSVRTNTVLDIKVYLASERNLLEKSSLQELKVVLMPNFNSADIVINVNGSENSINNPIHLTDNGFYLTDLMQINRYVDSNISTMRFPNGLSDIIKTFKFESDVLKFTNYLVEIKDDFTSSTDIIATINVYLNDDVIFKTFYCLVEANYAFDPVKELTIVYDGAPLDLTYMSDYFIGSNGKHIVGGTLTFKEVEESDLFTLSNNVLTVKNNLQSQAKTKLIAIYTVDDKVYVGAVDIVLEPKYSISANTSGVNFINSYSYDGSTFTINQETFTENQFADLYFTIYKANNKVMASSTAYELLESLVSVNGESFYKITMNLANTSESVYFKLTTSTTNYYYSELDDRNVYVGGDAINLLNCVGEFYNSSTNEVIEPYSELEYTFVALDDGVMLESDNLILSTAFSVYEKEYSILMSMLATDGNYYFAVLHIVVYPSVTVNLTYTQAGQSITIAKAGSTLNIKDYIQFSPQRSGVRDYVLNNTTTNYEVFVFDKEGNKVTSNLSSYFTLSGLGSGQVYSAIQPQLQIKLLADGYIFIVKATMQFDDGELSSYYYIKVDGISYSFTQSTSTYVLGEDDELNLNMFGSFSVGNVTDIRFEAIGSYYQVVGNKIVDTKNLYNKEVEILISAKYNGKDLFAIGKFILETKYVIENVLSLEDEFITNFEVLSTLKDINLLDSSYINTNAKNLLKNITINLFDISGAMALNKVYDFETLNDTNEFFTIYGDSNGAYFSSLDGVNLIGHYIVVQLEFNSLNHYKYIQYNLNFVDIQTGITVSSNTSSSNINISANNKYDLSTIVVKYGDETITSASHNFEYQISNNYCYIQNISGIDYLIANPYYVNQTSKLTITVRDVSNNFIGQGYLNIFIAGVNMTNTGNSYDLTTSGIPFKAILQINGDDYLGELNEGTINSKVYNKSGALIVGESYAKYLDLIDNVLYLKENLLVPEDTVIELMQDIEIKNNGVVTDIKQYKMIVRIASSKVSLFVNGVKVASDLKGGYTYNVTSLNSITIDFKLGENTFIPSLTLITTNLSNAVSTNGNRINIHELYANATASIIASNTANALQTIIDIKFGDYNSYDYSKMNVPAIDVGETFENGDEIIVLEASTGNVVDNATENVYAIVLGECQVLKYGYVICVNDKTGIVVNSNEIYSLKIYKTIEKYKDYNITLNGNASHVIDIFTTDNKATYPLQFVLDGQNVPATYKILDVTGSTDYLDLNLAGSNLSVCFNGYDVSTTTKEVKFILVATYNGVDYSKQYVVNIRSPFVTSTTYSYEFSLDDYKENQWQKVLSLDNFSRSINGLTLTAYAEVVSGSDKLRVDQGQAMVYAYVPNYNINYTGTSAIITSENGYEGRIRIDYYYFLEDSGNDLWIGESFIDIKVNKLSGAMGSSSVSYDKQKQVTLNASDENLNVTVSTEVNGPVASIMVNGEVIESRTALSSIEVKNLTDATINEFASYYTVSDSLSYVINKDKVSNRTKLFLMFTAVWVIDGIEQTITYMLPISFTNTTNAVNGETLHSTAKNVEILPTLTISSSDSYSLSIQELKTRYTVLSSYELTFEQIDVGYTINAGNINLFKVQNAGITYVKIVGKNSTNTNVFYLPINRSVGYGTTLQYVVKDNIALYQTLYEFSSSTEQVQAIKNTLGITSDIVATKMEFKNNYLLFNVRVVTADADMNLVSSYYLLEVRNTVYSYYKNYNVSFTGLNDAQLLVSSIISDEGEVVSVIDCDDKYLTCLNITNEMITIKPIFKDIVVPLTLITSKDGLFRYYYVNLTIKAVTKTRAGQELDIALGDRLIRGSNLTLTMPSKQGFDFEWQVFSGTDVEFSNNVISTTTSTALQTICVCLLARSTFGDYVFTHYVDIVDNSFEALYEQQVFTVYSGRTVDLSTLGVWNLKVNGEVLTDLSAYDITYTYTKLSGNNGFVISGNTMSTYFSLADNVVKINCNINIKDKGSFDATIYLTVQSGIEFIAGIYEVAQNSTFSLISQSVVSEDLISGLVYQIVSTTVTDNSIYLTETGRMQITNLASQGDKDFVVKVSDGAGVSKTLSFTLKVTTASRQYFEYTAPTNVSIYSTQSKRFTLSVDDIGEFKLASTTIGDAVYEEQILNNATGYDFTLNYNGSLLEIVGKTIYAGEVLDATTVTVQVILHDLSNEYIGYMSIEILPIYEFDKISEDTVYEVEPNSTLIVENLVNIYKNDLLINDYASENINMTFEFVGDVPQSVSDTSISFGYNDAGKLYKLKITYEYNGEEKEIHYIISVGVITYNIEVKSDIYNIYSGQSIDLCKLNFKFFDKEGYEISLQSNDLQFTAVEGTEEYYEIANGVITAKDTFEPILTSFYVVYDDYVGEVALTINATYELELDEQVSIYAGKASSLQFNLVDTYREINVTNSGKFTYKLVILDNKIGDLNSFAIDHRYSNQTINATFTVYNADSSKVYLQKVLTISVLQSRFLNLESDSIFFDTAIVSENGENLLDLISVLDENGNNISLNASDFTAQIIVGDSTLFENITDLVYRYNATIDEAITIRITDNLSGQYVDYKCMVTPINN